MRGLLPYAHNEIAPIELLCDLYPFLIRGRSKIRPDHVESDVHVPNSVPASRSSEFLVYSLQSGTVPDSSDVTQDFPQNLTRNILKSFLGLSRLPLFRKDF